MQKSIDLLFSLLIFVAILFDLQTYSQANGNTSTTNQVEDNVQNDEKIKFLEEKIAELENKVRELEKSKLTYQPLKYEEEEEEGEEEFVQKTFTGGARALQAQNPEISVTGDFIGRLYINDRFRKPYYLGNNEHEEHNEHEKGEHEHGASELSGFELRLFEIAIQSNLDPYSFAKAAVGLHGSNFHLCEAYMTWTGILPRFTLTVGKLRQQFGTINRWHEHALDQVDLPLSIQHIFGEEGLSQTGISMKIMLPHLWAHANELTVEITNSENSSLFAGEFWSIPSFLGHIKNYYDLSESTYFEIGLSGLWGLNNRENFPEENEQTGETKIVSEPRRNTIVIGTDLTLAWIPPELNKYRWFIWRTEGMYLRKETEDGIIQTFSGFTYFDLRISQIFILGLRLDAGEKPEIGSDKIYVQASPYITIWPSEWVFLRLQYNVLWQKHETKPQHLVLLQIDFSAGPHKHEKY